jgi:hypothetical protein
MTSVRVMIMNSVTIGMMKINKLFLLPLSLSVLSFFLFTISPSTLDENGILNEPFYLILIGYGLLFLAIGLLVYTFLKQD